ncbi:hypothetical protein OCU04_012137 [Sclerotinia nivalis]|uniref:Uncharacterized protein n=1 Tax=Sclerotinia nivalis TaxID=352851 RepID=A0A9X0DFT9_9HELO|nr:hypothetical protein OCU04_012137 [Sclerotinia nivalis]
MTNLTISEFLTIPHKPLIRHLTKHIKGGNTISRSHGWDYTDIRCAESWDQFSLETLTNRFGPLFDLRISSSSLQDKVPGNYLKIRSEHRLEILLHMTRLTRVNIALQYVNKHLIRNEQLSNRFERLLERHAISPGLQYGAGKPDLTFHLYADHDQLSPLAVGDIKLSAKWSYDRWKSPILQDRVDFRQVLAQINYYMRNRKCRYAVVITEVECVAVYRVPGFNGWLKLSEPFPVDWTDNMNSDNSDVMTANVALLGLSLWAQWAADAEEEEVEEEDAELDDYFPEEPSSPPMPSSPPVRGHLTSEYLPSSQY